MELGGNKNATVYFEKNGMFVDGKPNHKAPQLTKYKADLLKKVELALGSTLQSQGSAVFSNTIVTDKKDDILAGGVKNIQFGSDNLFDSKGVNIIGGEGSPSFHL